MRLICLKIVLITVLGLFLFMPHVEHDFVNDFTNLNSYEPTPNINKITNNYVSIVRAAVLKRSPESECINCIP